MHAANAYAHLAPESLPALLDCHDRASVGEGLAKALSRPEPMVKGLVAFGERAALPIAKGLLSRKTALSMEVSARALVELATPECAPFLVKALGEGKAVQHAATSALRRLGESARAALETGAQSKKKALREAAIALLHALPSESSSPDPAEAIYEAARQLDTQAREAIEAALRAAAALSEALREPALKGLIETQRGLVALALLCTRKEMDSSLSIYATLVTLLRKEHGEVACAVAMQMLRRVDPPARRLTYYFQPIAMTFGRAPHAFPAALRALEGPDFPLRADVFAFLTTLLDDARRREAEGVLVAGLSSDSKRIRALAVVEVLKLGEASVPKVTPLLASKSADVRLAAAEVLRALRSPAASEALKAAFAVEKKAPVAAALEQALAACGEAATPSPSATEAATETGAAEAIEAALRSTKAPKLPSWLDAAKLPALHLRDGSVLAAPLVLKLLTRLMLEGPTQEDAVAREVRARLGDASCDALSGAILEAWRTTSDAKQKWAIYQVGILGNEARITAAAETLGDLASKNHTQASWWADAIARAPQRGTPDVAQSWLHHWAHEGQKSLSAKARTLLNGAIAVDAHIADALRDKAIRLDEGSDAGGPRMSLRMKTEVARLEWAMVSGRRFTKPMLMHLLAHPWMHTVIERLIWRTDEGVLFRIAERAPIDVAYGPVSLSEHTRVDLVHPLAMQPEERTAWGTHLAESEVVQPFPQVGREVYAPDTTFDASRTQRAPALHMRLVDLGWRDAMHNDSAFFSARRYPGRGQRAVLDHDMLTPDAPPARIRALAVTPDTPGYAEREHADEGALDLQAVHPIVFSEVMRDVLRVLA